MSLLNIIHTLDLEYEYFSSFLDQLSSSYFLFVRTFLNDIFFSKKKKKKEYMGWDPLDCQSGPDRSGLMDPIITILGLGLVMCTAHYMIIQWVSETKIWATLRVATLGLTRMVSISGAGPPWTKNGDLIDGRLLGRMSADSSGCTTLWIIGCAFGHRLTRSITIKVE